MFTEEKQILYFLKIHYIIAVIETLIKRKLNRINCISEKYNCIYIKRVYSRSTFVVSERRK